MPRDYDDDDDDRPRRRRSRDDDDEDDDRPRSRRREVDDDDDRPRSRRRRREEDSDDEPSGGLIPTENKPALFSYYLGFLSLLPAIGIIAGPAAIILGFMGISKANNVRRAGGKGHAITGLLLGAAGFLICSSIWIAVFYILFKLP